MKPVLLTRLAIPSPVTISTATDSADVPYIVKNNSRVPSGGVFLLISAKKKPKQAKQYFFYMGHSVRDREMIKVKEEFESKFTKEEKNDQHNLLSNMVDARACYKPSERFPDKH